MDRVERLYPFLFQCVLLLIYFQFYLKSHRLFNVVFVFIFIEFVLSFRSISTLSRKLIILIKGSVYFLIILSLNFLLLANMRFGDKYTNSMVENMRFRILSPAILNENSNSLSFIISPTEAPLVRLKAVVYRSGYKYEKFRKKNYNEIPDYNKLSNLRYDTYQKYSLDSIYRARIKISPIRNLVSKCSFDSEQFYASKGIFFKAEIKEDDILVEDRSENHLFSAIIKLRYSVDKILSRYLKPESIALYKALMLSDRDYWERSWNKYLTAASLSHLLAASAFHLSLYISFIYFFLKQTSLGIRTRKVLAALVALLFLVISMGSNSLLRCTFYFFYCIAAAFFKKSIDPLTALTQATIILLFIDPLLFMKTGFAMSFAASFAVFIAMRIDEYFNLRNRRLVLYESADMSLLIKRSELKKIMVETSLSRKILKYDFMPVLRALIQSILIYCMIQIFMAYFILDFANRISLFSIFYNFICSLILFGFIIFTSLFIVISFLAPFQILKSIVAAYAEFMSECFYSCLQSVTHGVWAKFLLDKYFYFSIVLILFVLVILLSYLLSNKCKKAAHTYENNNNLFGLKLISYTHWTNRKRYIAILASICICVIISIFYLHIVREKPVVLRFISGGTGDLAILEYDNKRVMIDGAKEIDSDYYLDSYLERQENEIVDLAIISHMHEDHYGGIKHLLERGLIKCLYMRDLIFPLGYSEKEKYEVIKVDKMLTELAKKSNCRIIRSSMLPELKLNDEIVIKLIEDGIEESSDENDRSLCQVLEINKYKILFTGDISEAREKNLIKGLKIKNYSDFDFLKVAHHGSSYSSSVEFLTAFDFINSVITVGKNRYGHPSQQTIKRLEEYTYSLYRTDLDGDIVIIFNKDASYEIHTEKLEKRPAYLADYKTCFMLIKYLNLV